MDTKYMSREDRKTAKRAARKSRKAILLGLSAKQLKTYRKSGKGLREFAESIGKNIAKTPLNKGDYAGAAE